jgi:maleylacetoacetate isomerase/maleylpyruvate isomerase
MTRTLYTYWRSSASYRVRIALALKGLAYEQVAINLQQGAQTSVGFTMMNPQGLIPYLIDGDVGLNQSLAIVEYLDETYPDPPLLPADTVGRARVRAAALAIACDIHPLNNLRVLKYLRAEMQQEQAAVDTWYRHWVEVGFTALEEIAEAATGAYLFGETVTLADVCLVPQMWNARRLQADIARFPKLMAIDARLNALPAVRAARPEAQPDAVR